MLQRGERLPTVTSVRALRVGVFLLHTLASSSLNPNRSILIQLSEINSIRVREKNLKPLKDKRLRILKTL